MFENVKNRVANHRERGHYLNIRRALRRKVWSGSYVEIYL
jgi:hypothetical protein